MRLREVPEGKGVDVKAFNITILLQPQIRWIEPPSTPSEEYYRKMAEMRLQRSLDIAGSIIQGRIDNLFGKGLPITQDEFDRSLEGLFK